MKNKDILDALNDIDWDMVEDARATDGIKADGVKPAAKRKKMPKGFLTKGALAAACLCLAVITVFNVLPRLNSTTPPTPGGDETPGDKSNVEMILPGNEVTLSNNKSYKELLKSLLNAAEDPRPPREPDGDDGEHAEIGKPASGTAQQIVDNQVEGVEEGDIIKRTDTHVFYLYQDPTYVTPYNYVCIYTLNGEDTKFSLRKIQFNDIFKDYPSYRRTGKELYLSADGKTLSVIIELGRKDVFAKPIDTAIVYFDVSDPKNVKHINTVKLSGEYKSSRMIDDKLVVFTTFDTTRIFNESDPSTYIPRVENDGKMEYIPEENIYVPNRVNSSSYTVMALIDDSGREIMERAAVMSFAEGLVYVSSDNVFLTRSVTDKVESHPIWMERSEILCMSLSGEPFDVKGYVKVNGDIENRYCLDEYNGTLRVVTTAATQIKKIADRDEKTLYEAVENVDLYCFDSETFDKKAEIIAFAPDEESVQSVRFEGDRVYVCTALITRNPIDPVFFFDLSDVNNITYTHTGIISGYSTSLIAFPDGNLVGIGVDESKLKLEAYKEEGDKVVTVDAYKSVHCPSYSYSYKNYFIDSINGYIGIQAKSFEYDEKKYTIIRRDKYILVQFDGEKFVEIMEIDTDGEPNVRGFISDGYLYIASVRTIRAFRLA